MRDRVRGLAWRSVSWTSDRRYGSPMQRPLGCGLGIAAALLIGANAAPAGAQAPISVGAKVSGIVVRGGEASFRLDRNVRTGDELQLSVAYYGTLCVLPPVGGPCPTGTALEEGEPLARVVVPYTGPSGYPVIQLAGQHHRRAEAYALIVERVIRRVVLSAGIPAATNRDVHFAVRAHYGDGSFVPNGLASTLTWRYAGTSARRTLATAAAKRGILSFTGRLPAAARGRLIEIRTCVPQSGGSARCLSRSVRVSS